MFVRNHPERPLRDRRLSAELFENSIDRVLQPRSVSMSDPDRFANLLADLEAVMSLSDGGIDLFRAHVWFQSICCVAGRGEEGK